MFTRAMAAATALLLAGTAVSAQMPGMQGGSQDGMAGMMDQRMMMDGMMGQGMMGSGMMQMMGQGMGMMATGGPGPGMILRMAEPLDLTGEQITRLESIRADLLATEHGLMQEAMEAHGRAQEILGGADAPDFDAYEEALQDISEKMVDVHVAMARAAVGARDVLTEEQREHLQEGMGMMQGMTGGGMMHGEGMQRDGSRMPHGDGGQMPHGGGAPH